MNYSEFINSSCYVQRLGTLAPDCDLGKMPGYVFADYFWLVDTSEQPGFNYRFYLIIGNSEYQSNDIKELLPILWQFAEPEINSEVMK